MSIWSKWKKKLLSKDANSFVRVFGLLSGSTFIVQLISLAVYPIISRIYAPEYFGERAIFVSVLTLLIALATLGYEIAINIPKEEGEAIQLTRSGIYLVGISSLIFTLCFFIIGQANLVHLGIGSIWTYRYLIPIGLFMGGSFQLLQHWLLRKENYSIVSKTRIARSISKSGLELTGGFIHPNSWWLILAWLIGNFSSSIRYFLLFIKKSKQFSWPNFRTTITILSKYIRFPKYQVVSNFLRTFYIQMPVFVFSYAFGVFEAGQFAIAYTVFSVACAIMIDAFSQYHLVQMGQLLNKRSSTWQKYYRSMLLRSLKLSIPVALLMIFFGKWCVIVVFGNEWKIAGEMLRYFSIIFVAFFLYTFNFHIFTQLQKQDSHLIFNAIRLFLLLISIFMLGGIDIKLRDFLLVYGLLDLMLSIIQTYWSYRILSINFTDKE